MSGSQQNEWPNNRWSCHRALAKGRTYRVELKLTRTGDRTMTFEPRAYDSAGALICGESDFLNVNSSTTLARRPALNIRDVTWLQGFQVGFNGLNRGTAAEFPLVLYSQGAVCIRANDWCGPYSGNQ